MRTWQSQDACALSRHSKLCKQSSWSQAKNSQETGEQCFSSQQVVWAPEVPPGPLLFHEKRPWICTPANARYPITAKWTGGTGRRQMENQMENCLSWLNSGPHALSQVHCTTTQPPHIHTHTHTHTHTHILDIKHKRNNTLDDNFLLQ